MKRKGLLITIILMMLMTIGGNAWGLCIADSDNDEASATSIGYEETVSGWVCPDTDSFDFYRLDIPEGGEVSGSITFNSPQESTVLRIYYYDGDTQIRILDDAFTHDGYYEFTVHIAAGSIPAATYYARVFFWSAAAYDHQYTLTMDLTVTGLSDCQPDDNESPETSAEIAVGSSVNDWVCDADHLDIWHFDVSPDDEDDIQITLDADPGELVLYVYNEDGDELYKGPTEGGRRSVNLGTLLEESFSFTLPADLYPFEKKVKWGKKYYKKEYTPGGKYMIDPGILGGYRELFKSTNDYYIGVFLPLDRDDENSYTLSVRKRYLLDPGMLGEFVERIPFDPIGPVVETPWGSRFGSYYNAGRSTFNGPSGPMFSSLKINKGLSRHDMVNNHMLFQGLLIGPNSTAYMLEKPNKLLHIINLNDGSTKGTRQTDSHKSPCLGPDGSCFFIHEGGRSLDSIGGFSGRVSLPTEGQHAVEMVGNNIFVSTFVPGEASSYVHCISLDGDLLWTNGPLDGRVAGVAETPGGPVYIQTGRALYKFNSDGVADWFQTFRMGFPGGGPYAPLVGMDGKIWCYHPMNHSFSLYKSDGSFISSRGFGEAIRAVTFGSDGRFYVALRNRVMCFNNWNDLAWEQYFTPEINDMIMGQDNKLYISQIGRIQAHPGFPYEYDSNLITVNSLNGATINRQRIDLRTEAIDVVVEQTPVFGYHDLAIGEGGKIISLHYSGQLEVFSPQLIAVFGVFESLGSG